MNSLFNLPLLLVGLLLVGLLLGEIVQAQSPTLDPTFYNGDIYQPGAVSQALRQPDG